MIPVLPALYLPAITWAILACNKRWLTSLWIVVGLVAIVLLAFVRSLIWPHEAEFWDTLLLQLE
jgi:hypothetical protein